MKGIVLAGGLGTRLYPITKGVSKQLLPVYDKPMIYYPISVLIMAGINDILIISNLDDIGGFKKLLGDGKNLGISFSYAVQKTPDGLAQAFIIGKDFIKNENVCLILGDNIFYGNGLEELVANAKARVESKNIATIFSYYVNKPNRYGVVEFDDNGEPKSIIEKPKNPKSNQAVVGLYFYPNSVLKIAKDIKPSKRGELEITSINEIFLSNQKLSVQKMGVGYAWLDTGTHESLVEAGEFIKAIEKRQGLKIGCIEEVALEKGFINKSQALEIANQLKMTDYGQYLIKKIKYGSY